MESPSDGAEHGRRDAARLSAESHAAGRWSQPSAGSRTGLPAGAERGPAGGLGQTPAGSPPLERAPKPMGLRDLMQLQVDRAFADFLGGDYTAPCDDR